MLGSGIEETRASWLWRGAGFPRGRGREDEGPGSMLGSAESAGNGEEGNPHAWVDLTPGAMKARAGTNEGNLQGEAGLSPR